jgi:hypothetical protein
LSEAEEVTKGKNQPLTIRKNWRDQWEVGLGEERVKAFRSLEEALESFITTIREREELSRDTWNHINEFLHVNPGSTERELRESASGPVVDNIAGILRDKLRRGRLYREGAGGLKDPFRYYPRSRFKISLHPDGEQFYASRIDGQEMTAGDYTEARAEVLAMMAEKEKARPKKAYEKPAELTPGLVVSIADLVKSPDVDRVAEGVLLYLTASKHNAPISLIRVHIAGSTATIRAALKRLVEEGKVERSGKGSVGDPYRYAALEEQGVNGWPKVKA